MLAQAPTVALKLSNGFGLQDEREKAFRGDNFVRHSGDYHQWEALTVHAHSAFDKGQDIHAMAAPSQVQRGASLGTIVPCPTHRAECNFFPGAASEGRTLFKGCVTNTFSVIGMILTCQTCHQSTVIGFGWVPVPKC